MTPLEHSFLSVRDFGGKPEDYLKIHEFLDQTKGYYPDWRHRMILHNSFGMILTEQFYGPGFKNSDGKLVSTREIARRHIVQDLGFVPTIQDWMREVKFNPQSAKRFNSPNEKDIEYLRNAI